MATQRSALLAVWILAAATVLQGCSDGTADSPITVEGFAAARGSKAGSGPSVTLADPAWGNQGQTGEQVHIFGSGFEPGSQAEWLRNGMPDPKVRVTATAYVSSTELIATIDIAVDAELDFYDIAVTRPDRKSGIGTEKFEVTLAVSIGSLAENNTLARAVNENGEVVGYSSVTPETHAFYWSEATGMVDLGVGGAWGIAEDGLVVAGYSGPVPVVWTRSGSAWVRAELPTAERRGSARSLASDPVTGTALYISGHETTGSKRNEIKRPVLWKNVDGAWERTVLPVLDGSAVNHVMDVNTRGQAVGKDVEGAVVWEDASTVRRLPGPASTAQGIRGDGNLIVGYYQPAQGGGALYWVRQPDGTWSPPHPLPGCMWGMDVDDDGVILTSNCAAGSPAIWSPPYTTPLYLGRLGLKNESAHADAITNSGRFAVGSATAGSYEAGVIWRIR